LRRWSAAHCSVGFICALTPRQPIQSYDVLSELNVFKLFLSYLEDATLTILLLNTNTERCFKIVKLHNIILFGLPSCILHDTGRLF
jgi:hypothetical protein